MVHLGLRSKRGHLGQPYARLAIAAAFLSAVAGRFGLWAGTPGLSRFDAFIERTAALNFYAPAAAIPVLAWAATLAETGLAVALLAGVWVRGAALGQQRAAGDVRRADGAGRRAQVAARLLGVLRLGGGAAAGRAGRAPDVDLTSREQELTMQTRFNYASVAPGVYKAMDALDRYLADCAIERPSSISSSCGPRS